MWACFGCAPTFFNPRACQRSSKDPSKLLGNDAPCGMVRDCAKVMAETSRKHGDIGWFCQWFYTPLFGNRLGKTRFRNDIELEMLDLKINWFTDVILPTAIGVATIQIFVHILENWEKIVSVIGKSF